jgi:hypothetical protein
MKQDKSERKIHKKLTLETLNGTDHFANQDVVGGRLLK